MGGVLGGHYSMRGFVGRHYCQSKGDTSASGVLGGQYSMDGVLVGHYCQS